MVVRNRIYPYPVLAYFLHDYKETSTFEVKPSLIIDGFRQIINFDILLENTDLRTMVDKSQAEIILHMECSQTGYRHILVIPVGKTSISFIIPNELVSGKMQVCPFIVAAQDLDSYKNTEFDDDFDNLSFSLERGNILAVAKQIDIDIKKKTDDLRNLPSIINVMLNADTKQQYMQINLDESLINVLLPAYEWQQFGALSESGRLDGVFSSIIAVPALTYTLGYLQREGVGGRVSLSDDGKIWYDCIKRALLENFKIDLESEAFDNRNAFELAQALVNGPLDKALKELIRSRE